MITVPQNVLTLSGKAYVNQANWIWLGVVQFKKNYSVPLCTRQKFQCDHTFGITEDSWLGGDSLKLVSYSSVSRKRKIDKTPFSVKFCTAPDQNDHMGWPE